MLLDLQKLNTKTALLSEFMKFFDEMYSCNYDALIDAAVAYDKPVTFSLSDIELFQDRENLAEVCAIIEKENALIKFIMK